MASDLKSFPPSEYKIKKLREQGIVPRSRELMLFGAVAGLCLALLLFRTLGSRLRESAAASWGGTAPKTGSMDAALANVFSFSLLLLVPIVAAILLLGAYQTGFIFGANLVRFDFGRVFQFGLRFRVRFAAAFLAVIRGAAWAAVSWLIARKIFEWAAEYSNATSPVSLSVFTWLSQGAQDNFLRDTRAVIEQGQGQLLAVVFAVLGFSFLLGILSRFAAVMAFQNEHAMSRAELEAESRELESPPDIRRRIGELREE